MLRSSIQLQKLSFRGIHTKAKVAISPYIYLKGNATQAIDFYAGIFEANVTVKATFADGPLKVEDDWRSKIMHSSLSFGDNIVMISDDYEGRNAAFAADSIQLSIAVDDLNVVQKMFDGLSVGGVVKIPLAKQFWGATFGKITDRFGVTWLLNCETK